MSVRLVREQLRPNSCSLLQTLPLRNHQIQSIKQVGLVLHPQQPQTA